MIFFMSISFMAAILASNMVIEENVRMKRCMVFDVMLCLMRIIMNTPAVTRVEECTNADTGVGAAMAAGSHAENGICALLVMAARVMSIIVIVMFDFDRIIQFAGFSIIAILKIMHTSPIRLESTVIIPAPRDLAF
jgi:hypothetical protein